MKFFLIIWSLTAATLYGQSTENLSCSEVSAFMVGDESNPQGSALCSLKQRYTRVFGFNQLENLAEAAAEYEKSAINACEKNNLHLARYVINFLQKPFSIYGVSTHNTIHGSESVIDGQFLCVIKNLAWNSVKYF